MNLNQILNFEAKNINVSALIIAVSSLISRLLGVVRDRLLASSFGAGPELDVYFAAFRLPDFIYNILIAGGVVVAFLPLFSEYFLKDKEESWKFVSNVLNIFFFLLVVASLILFIFTPFFIRLITPGFDSQQVSSTILLTRFLFLSPILLGLSSIFSGILQYFNKFIVYSLSPVFYNLGIILGIIFLAPSLGIFGVALGVILGAFLHLSIQIPSAFRAGFSFKPIFNFQDSKIKKIFSLMAFRTLGVASPQINLMIVTFIASTLPVGALSIFNFVNNLGQFPLGLIGIPFAVSSFPVLSKSFAAGDNKNFLETFWKTLRKVLYFSLPASLLILVLRNQIIDIILKTGRFDESSAQLAAASLGLFALGIWATCLIPLFLRAFFACQDTKTPTIIALVTMVLNLILCFWFVRLFNSVLGLALAFSVDSIFQVILLAVFLKRRIKFV